VGQQELSLVLVLVHQDFFLVLVMVWTFCVVLLELSFLPFYLVFSILNNFYFFICQLVKLINQLVYLVFSLGFKERQTQAAAKFWLADRLV
jgi:hypothetical protein